MSVAGKDEFHRGSDGAADTAFESLKRRYAAEGDPLEVNFRQLAPGGTLRGRGAHLIHPYPAKLLPNISQFFLACPQVTDIGTRLLDPFCGSGTVLLEGQFAGLDVQGADANPLARLITQAKLTHLSSVEARAELDTIVAAAATAVSTIPDVVNRSHWFSDRISQQLGQLRTCIEATVPPVRRAFFDVCFSATVRRVSYADPRLSVPVRINPERAAIYGAKGAEVLRRLTRLETVDVLQVFWSTTAQAIQRGSETSAALGDRGMVAPLLDNALDLTIADGSIDIIMTSPPYVGAQKYIRASSLCLGWLGLTPGAKLRPYERISVGREHLAPNEAAQCEPTIAEADELLNQIAVVNPLRSRIARMYLLEMRQAVAEMHRVLRPGGRLILVAGPNIVAGHPFPTPQFIETICHSIGFETEMYLLDTIHSRGLMTKRNKTAGLISQEAVISMVKSGGDA